MTMTTNKYTTFDALTSTDTSFSSDYYSTSTTPIINPSDYLTTHINSHMPLYLNNFNKMHRTLSEKDFISILNLLKVENTEEYLAALYDIITHPGFRKLSDEYLVEIATDIEKVELEYHVSISDHCNMDDYPGFKLLRVLKNT